MFNDKFTEIVISKILSNSFSPNLNYISLFGPLKLLNRYKYAFFLN